MKYRTRVPEIEAIQYIRDNVEEVREFLGYKCEVYTSKSQEHILTTDTMMKKLDYGTWFIKKLGENDFGWMTDKDFKEKWEKC